MKLVGNCKCLTMHWKQIKSKQWKKPQETNSWSQDKRQSKHGGNRSISIPHNPMFWPTSLLPLLFCVHCISRLWNWMIDCWLYILQVVLQHSSTSWSVYMAKWAQASQCSALHPALCSHPSPPYSTWKSGSFNPSNHKWVWHDEFGMWWTKSIAEQQEQIWNQHKEHFKYVDLY